MINIKKTKRLLDLPPYLFVEIDRMKDEQVAKGVDIINLGVGDPDLPPPVNIVEKLKEAVNDPKNHQYPSYKGLYEFRRSISRWYKMRFNVDIDPQTEVVSLIGSKEGIGHIPLAFVEQGDVVLVPSPGYPVYNAGTIFAGGTPCYIPLLKENGFIPDLNKITGDIAKKTKIMFINYPNNPTAAVCEMDFFEEVVEFAKRYNIIVCHDAAYSEISFDGYKAHSFLEAEGAKDIGIEFHSLSKTYNMTGWRIGFAVGNRDVIDGLGQIKSNLDSGIFQAIQIAGIEALESDQTHLNDMRQIYQTRRDILIKGLVEAGLEVNPPKATFYVWVKVTDGYTSTDFTTHLLKGAGIVTTPGVGFGKEGEGYIRMALTVDRVRMEEAANRIKKLGF